MSRGPKWLQKIVNGIRDFAISRAITGIIVRAQADPGEPLGAQLRLTPSGTLVTIIVGGAAGGAVIPPTPWQITVDGNASDGYNAHVAPGSVNSLVPSNIFDAFSLSASTAYYVKIECDTDGKTPNDITVEVDTSAVDASTAVAENVAPSSFWDTLGIIVTGDADMSGAFTSTIFQIRSVNLWATPTVAFLESQTPVNPGDEAFVRWWTWNLAEGD
jgi:hypothetical protein